MTAPHPTLGIVGGGAVAHALGAALSTRWSLRVWARRPGAAASVVGAADAGAQVAPASAKSSTPPSHTVAETPADLAGAGVVLVAVTDSAIGEVAERLQTALGEGPGPMVLHTSGALTGEDALAPLSALGWGVGSLHPLVAVAPATRPPRTVFRGMPLAIEGTHHLVLERAEELVADLGGYALRLPQVGSTEAARVQKARYHALATMVATGVVALVDQAAASLVAAGGDDTDDASKGEAVFREAYAQLALSAAQNVLRAPGADVLTGAVARDDQPLIERHLRALRGLDEANLYRAMETAARIMLQRRGAGSGS